MHNAYVYEDMSMYIFLFLTFFVGSQYLEYIRNSYEFNHTIKKMDKRLE